MVHPLGIGIIGAGRIGKVHAATLASLSPSVQVKYITDVVPAASQALAKECGATAVDSHEDIFGDAAVDAVMICSSTNTHATLIEQAANAGKHVFCEKPIALEMDRIDMALATVEKNGVLLMVGFNRRFDAGNARLRHAVQSGAIGTPELCVISSRDPAPPPLEYVAVSGGLFLDMMIHDFDLARFLMGEEPVQIFAHGSCLVDPGIGRAGDVDTAMVSIRFRSGALCHINNSRRAVYGYDQRAEVFGSGGMVETTNLHMDNTVLATANGYSRPPLMNFFMDRYAAAYREEARVFVDCVREGRQPPASGADGRIAVVMGYAAKQSLEAGRPVAIAEPSR